MKSDPADLAARLKAQREKDSTVNLWLAFKASKAFAPVAWIAAVLAVIAFIFMLGRCTGPHDNGPAQAQQTNRSGEAAAAAASDAIHTLQDRTVTDAAVDKAVGQATKEIDNAQTVDAIHDTVVASVCGQASHRNDPACRVQQANP